MLSDTIQPRDVMQSLRERGATLAPRLVESAGALRASGLPPAAGLLQELAQLRQMGRELCTLLGASMPAGKLEFAGLENLVEEYEWKNSRAAAEEVVNTLLRIQHVDGEFAPLAQLHAHAHQVLSRAASVNERADLNEILREDRSLQCLIRLVSPEGGLADNEWDQCFLQVQRTWGTPLASAAARGRLIVGDAVASPTPNGASADSVESDCVLTDITGEHNVHDDGERRYSRREVEAAAAAAITAANASASGPGVKTGETPAGPDGSQDSIFDDEPSSNLRDRTTSSLAPPMPIAASDPLDALIFGDDETIDEPAVPDRSILNEPHFIQPEGPIAELARAALDADEERRTALIADLILHLVFEGRSGLAFHLSRCLAQRVAVSKPFLPAWLIRAWALGLAVRFPHGKLAGLLQDDFRRFTPQALAGHDRNWARALSIFVRAAAIRPMLVAPGTQAGPALKSFDMQAETVLLYNYCARIVMYGERIGGITPLDADGVVAASRDDKLASLQRDVAEWRGRVTRLGGRYEVVPPLDLYQRAHWSLRPTSLTPQSKLAIAWKQWQYAFQLAEPILRAVEDQGREQLEELRPAVERLRQRLRDGQPTEHDPNPGVDAALREALTLGESCLELLRPQQAGTASQDVRELREELDRRHDQVVEELQALAERHPSLETRISLACLTLAMHQVRELLRPRHAPSGREPDPRHLLHGELLKIHELQLDEQWEPVGDNRRVEELLLTYLCHPQPDWATAYQVQASEGNHDATERIASLDVWSDGERAALLAMREADLHPAVRPKHPPREWSEA